MGDRWSVEIDPSVCIGSGLCRGAAPEYFRLGAGHKSEPEHAEIDAHEPVLRTAEACPAEAILLRRVEDGELIFPPEDDD